MIGGMLGEDVDFGVDCCSFPFTLLSFCEGWARVVYMKDSEHVLNLVRLY